ncbi:membrane fusion protein, multidrug efflux system [Methylobacillus rhizosphaerae]|uniref:Membrane fusion protein, multidrug efflux system n=1 Tax=Methylobacillus rhizosphaerae TaxID=551994 RepID=A0A239A2L5_9PROT|nr:efflux RND transporter periplasmic adaptor subunit [Methylobacillus rhizosphaerae]SNR89875.1 membrane fusion protein, multidrug efflux system [Methylobacillus rhizosphaerae]
MIKKFSFALSVMAVLLAGCHPAEHAEEHEPLKLKVSSILRQDTSLDKEYVAQIHAIRHIEIRALEKGYLEKIFVDEGQQLNQGQPMFKIMPNVYQADLQKAKAEADMSMIEYQNTKALADKNIVSSNELALSKAKLDKANAEVNVAATHLGFTNINAPFPGIMDHLEVRNGSLLDEGDLLTTLSDISKMWVYFNVPETEYLDYISSKKSQSPEKVRLKMANGQVFGQEGVVETIEADFDNKTGNIEFRATFPNPDKILRHGQTGNILMSVPYKNAMLIPQKATFEILDKVYVYVVNKEDKIEQRLITIEAELPHLYVVKSGLADSDRILIEGLRKVQNGQKIAVDFVPPEKAVSDLSLYAE